MTCKNDFNNTASLTCSISIQKFNKMELKKYKLGECLELQRGYDLTSSQMQGGEVAVVGSNGIIGYHNVERGNSPCITVGRSGSVGKVHYYDQPTWAHNTALFIKDFKGNEPKYLYYFLQNLHLDKMLEKGSSVVPSLDRKVVHSLVVPFHKNINDQRKIVSVLSALDAKIELNKQINDNLEAMAKQLYDYWFVQFDFPNEEGKPYKSSGGAMVWNEKLKREIPQGWNDCVLGDYIGRITNGLNPRKNFVLGSGTNYYVTIRSLVGTTINWNNCDRCDDEALEKINSRSQLQIGDVIFSAIGTIGRTYYILEEPTNWNISETSFTLRAKDEVPKDFFYGMLRSNEIQTKADKAAMGSTLRCLVMDSLCSLQYIKIPVNMMKSFSAKVSPLYMQIHKNNKEIAELTKLRDELLPLLMNGQATVNYHLSDD